MGEVDRIIRAGIYSRSLVPTFPIGGNCFYFAWFNALKLKYCSNITPIRSQHSTTEFVFDLRGVKLVQPKNTDA
jgi:hypothetical protein